MTYIAAPAIGVTVFDARAFAPTKNYRIFRDVTVDAVTMAAAWALAACIAFAATWMMAASLTVNFNGRADVVLAPAPVTSAALCAPTVTTNAHLQQTSHNPPVP